MSAFGSPVEDAVAIPTHEIAAATHWSLPRVLLPLVSEYTVPCRGGPLVVGVVEDRLLTVITLLQLRGVRPVPSLISPDLSPLARKPFASYLSQPFLAWLASVGVRSRSLR